jgi:hypothetical protein
VSSSLSGTGVPVIAQLGMSFSSFEPPVVKYVLSLAEASVAAPAKKLSSEPSGPFSQSAPAAAESSALPSSSKMPSLWAARVGVGDARVTDCNASENRNSAVHSRVRLLRVRAFIANQSPRDIGDFPPGPPTDFVQIRRYPTISLSGALRGRSFGVGAPRRRCVSRSPTASVSPAEVPGRHRTRCRHRRQGTGRTVLVTSTLARPYFARTTPHLTRVPVRIRTDSPGTSFTAQARHG